MPRYLPPSVALLLTTSLALAADRPPLFPKAGPLDNRLCRIESRPGGPVTGDPAAWVDWIESLGVGLWVCSAVGPNCSANCPAGGTM